MNDPILLMTQLVDESERTTRERLAHEGEEYLTPPAERLLRLIDGKPTTCVSDLAAQVQVTQQAVSRTLTPLINSGHVVSRLADGDRRRHELTLSPRGHDSLRRLAEVRQEVWAALSKTSDVLADIRAYVESRAESRLNEHIDTIAAREIARRSWTPTYSWPPGP